MSGKSSVSRKYALWFSALSLGILFFLMVAVGVALWRGAAVLKDELSKGTRESFEQTHLAAMRNMAEYARLQVSRDLYNLDIEDINKLIENVRSGLAIKSFVIADDTGKVLTDGTKENRSYGETLSINRSRIRETPVIVEKIEGGYKMTFWVEAEGYSIGYGEIVFSDEPLRQALALEEKTVEESWRIFARDFGAIILGGVSAITLVTVIVSLVISRTFATPLIRLRDGANRIGAGDLEYRVAVDSDDEIGELGRSFNEMVQDLQRNKTELASANRTLQGEIEVRAAMGRALAEEKERLAVTLQSIGEGVIATDLEGRVMLINAVAEKLTGFAASEAVHASIDGIFPIHEETTNKPLENPVRAALRSGENIAAAGDAMFTGKSGATRSITYSCAPIRGGEGRIIGTVLVFRDTTERRRWEQDLSKKQKLESVGILAGGIAHDFNNLLTGIIGNVSLAKLSVGWRGEAHELLGEAEKAAGRAKSLTQQLLTFSKGGAPVTKIVAVRELLAKSCNFVLSGSKAKCEFDVAADLWPAHVDEGQIGRVFENLVINADQAMPRGGTISVKATNCAVTAATGLPLAPGDYVRIEFRDQGVGIAQEDLAKIFDPYFTTKAKGEGLGLATAYSIMKRHHGHIMVESTLAVGTAFTLFLPASRQASPAATPATKQAPVSGHGRILVMDDDAIIQELSRHLLKRLGYSVEIAPDGAEAVRLYRSAFEAGRPFDAVIMDLTIPGGMGGAAAIAHLIAIDKDVKGIVSSGYSNDPVMANYRSYGFCGVVTKPYDFQEFSALLHDIVGKGHSSSGPQPAG